MACALQSLFASALARKHQALQMFPTSTPLLLAVALDFAARACPAARAAARACPVVPRALAMAVWIRPRASIMLKIATRACVGTAKAPESPFRPALVLHSARDFRSGFVLCHKGTKIALEAAFQIAGDLCSVPRYSAALVCVVQGSCRDMHGFTLVISRLRPCRRPPVN